MAERSTNYEPRNGESKTREFDRTGRFFCQQGNWFFRTREGMDYGPFTSRTECKYAFEEFIDVVSTSRELGGIAVDFHDTSGEWQVPKINFN